VTVTFWSLWLGGGAVLEDELEILYCPRHKGHFPVSYISKS